MAPQRQEKTPRKQNLLKLKERGPEAQRKKMYVLDRLLEIQENNQPNPFLNTALGKPPPEFPVKIHQSTFVAPEIRADSESQNNTFTTENILSAGSTSGASRRFLRWKDCDLFVLRTPFAKTGLGKLPPELRTQIYHELVAILPSYAGQESTTKGICAEKRNLHGPATLTTTLVHLQASCLNVLETCRRIYVEAHPLFYARTSYYAANAKAIQQLLYLNLPLSSDSPLRSSRITSLFVKDLLSPSLDRFTPVFSTEFEEWESLRKIYFYMRVGEEIEHIEFLFRLPRMGVV